MTYARAASLLLLFTACAGGPPAATSPGESARVAAALAEIDLAIARGNAGPLLERWVTASRSDPEDGVAAFLAAASLSDREASWKALRDRADHHPREAWPHLGMARIYVLWDTWDQAALSVEKALERAPGEPLLKVLQAEVLAHAGRRDGARAALAAVIAAHPDLHEAHAALGRVLLGAGDATQARPELEAALRLEARDLRSRSALADLCAAAGDTACARENLEELARLVPEDAPLQLRLAEARFAADDRAGAAPAYAAARVMDDGDEGQLSRAALAFRAAGDGASEVAALRRLNRVRPGVPDTLRRIAELEVARGASAEQAYAALFAVAPDDPAANLGLARAAAAKGDLHRAAASFRRAVAGGAAEAAAELRAIEDRAGLVRPPIDGRRSVNAIAARVLAVAGKIAAQRRKENPQLAGAVVARVAVDASGKAKEVSILEDSTGDAVVTACVYLNLLDARYPARAAEYRLEIPVR